MTALSIRDEADYLHGYCHLFAYALAKLKGWPIEALWDVDALTDDLEELPPCLVHMWVVTPDQVKIDILGRIEEMHLDDFPCNEGEIRRHTLEEVEAMMARNVLEPFKDNELEELFAFLEANPARYRLGAGNYELEVFHQLDRGETVLLNEREVDCLSCFLPEKEAATLQQRLGWDVIPGEPTTFKARFAA